METTCHSITLIRNVQERHIYRDGSRSVTAWEWGGRGLTTSSHEGSKQEDETGLKPDGGDSCTIL